jgi:hypothetical protein
MDQLRMTVEPSSDAPHDDLRLEAESAAPALSTPCEDYVDNEVPEVQSTKAPSPTPSREQADDEGSHKAKQVMLCADYVMCRFAL